MERSFTYTFVNCISLNTFSIVMIRSRKNTLPDRTTPSKTWPGGEWLKRFETNISRSFLSYIFNLFSKQKINSFFKNTFFFSFPSFKALVRLKPNTSTCTITILYIVLGLFFSSIETSSMLFRNQFKNKITTHYLEHCKRIQKFLSQNLTNYQTEYSVFFWMTYTINWFFHVILFYSFFIFSFFYLVDCFFFDIHLLFSK